MNYRVLWVIDCEAESPQQAAEWAQAVQQTPNIHSFFDVTDLDSGDHSVIDLENK